MITRISSAAVVVKDEKKAAQWYKSKLGLEIKSEEGHWVTVAPKGQRGFVLHLCKTKPLEKGNTGILFSTDDVQKTYRELASKGVKFSVKPRDDGWGTYAMFKDLDGNVFWMM
ncbi:MAG: VOC family protein [Thaumarchaeota archaeon]|nr:VOC family protein [Nitrososphaerota archaeon]